MSPWRDVYKKFLKPYQATNAGISFDSAAVHNASFPYQYCVRSVSDPCVLTNNALVWCTTCHIRVEQARYVRILFISFHETVTLTVDLRSRKEALSMLCHCQKWESNSHSTNPDSIGFLLNAYAWFLRGEDGGMAIRLVDVVSALMLQKCSASCPAFFLWVILQYKKPEDVSRFPIWWIVTLYSSPKHNKYISTKE